MTWATQIPHMRSHAFRPSVPVKGGRASERVTKGVTPNGNGQSEREGDEGGYRRRGVVGGSPKGGDRVALLQVMRVHVRV